MANKKVTYDIGFNTDTSSLRTLQNELLKIQNMTKEQYFSLKGVDAANNDLLSIKTAAHQVKVALDNSFNVKLNTFDIQSFNKQLTTCGLTVEDIRKKFSALGTQGQSAFIDLTSSIFSANTQLKKTKSFLDEMGDTILNAAKWSFAYGAINNISNGIKSAWSYAISLDSALNDIRIVTNKSQADMEAFALSTNKAAKALGTTTKNYTKGALIYYQQGLSEKDVIARTNVTAKAANVTGQTVQEVSEQLTAVWNGYKVAADEAENYVDKLAAVAAASASDLEELSIAMSRVASSASTMGINIDQLTAQIATIESVTRQDAASIGTALKTIYSRMGDLAIGAEDEFGVALGDVSGKMKQMGIDILDQAGNMRSMGTVIEEVAAKWNTWTSAQQQAAAIALAGKRQYNNLFALFENWDMYESNKSISENSLGELQKEQETYMQSTAYHVKTLTAAFDKLKDSFFDNDQMNFFIDSLASIIRMVDGLVTSLGGGANLLLQISGIVTKIYSGKIAQGISNFRKSFNEMLGGGQNTVNTDRRELANKFGITYSEEEKDSVGNQTINKIVEIEKQRQRYSSILTQADNDRYDDLIKQTAELGKQKLLYEDLKKIISETTTEEMLYSEDRRLAELEGGENSRQPGLIKKRIRDRNAISNYNADDAESKRKFAQDAAKRTIKTASNLYNMVSPEEQKQISQALEEVQKVMGKDNEITVDTTEKREALLKLNDAIIASYEKEAEAIKQKINAAREASGLSTQDLMNMSSEDKASFIESIDRRSGRVKNVLSGENSNNAKAIKNSDKDKKAAISNSKQLIKAAQDELKIGKLTVQQQTELEKVLKRVNDETQEGTKINLENQDVKSDLITLSDALDTAYKQEAKNCQYLKENFDSLGMSMDSQRIETEKVNEAQEEMAANQAFTAAMEKTINIASSVVSAYSSVVAIINQVKTAIKIAGDDSLSAAEKLEQVVGIVLGIFMTAVSVVSAVMPLIRTIIVSNIKKTGEEGAKEAAKANAKITAALGWIGLILAALAAIISLMITLATVLGNQKTPLEQATEDYKAASEALQEMQQNLQEVKKAYEDLVETIDNYKNARNAIENLKAGTEEWKEAIENANEQAMNLISSYDFLQDYMTIDNNGLISISNEGLDKLRSEQKQNIQKQRLAIISQQQLVNNKSLEIEKEKRNQERMDYFNAQLNERGLIGYFKNLDEIKAQGEIIREATDAVKKNTEANFALSKQYNRVYLENNGNTDYLTSSNQEAFVQAFTVLMNRVQDKYADTSSLFKKGGPFGFTWVDLTTEAKDIFIKALGADKNSIKVEGEKVKYTVNGGEPQELSAEQVLSIVNTYYKAQQINNTTSSIGNTINKISNSSVGAGLFSLIGATEPTILGDFKPNADYVKKLNDFANQLKDEDLINMGITGETPEDRRRNFKILFGESKIATNKKLNSLRGDIIQVLQDPYSLNNIQTQDLTVNQLNAVRGGFVQAFRQAGFSGTQTLVDLMANLSPEEQAAAGQAAANIDWTSSTNVQDFINQMELLGVTVDVSDAKWATFIENLKSHSNVLIEAANDFDKIRNALKEINELTKDLNVGDTISDEDYQKMLALNSEISKYFVQTADGYKMIKGSSSEINKLLKEPYQSLII